MTFHMGHNQYECEFKGEKKFLLQLNLLLVIGICFNFSVWNCVHACKQIVPSR